MGAGLGFGKGIEEKKSVLEAGKQAALTGAISGVIGVGIGGVAELAKYMTSSGVQESIVNRTLGIKAKVIEKGKSPAARILSEQGIASKKSLLDKSETIITNTEKELQQILKNNTKPIQSSNVLNQVELKLKESYRLALSDQEITAIVEKLPLNELKKNPQISLKVLNDLRRVIDNQYIGNSKWLGISTAENITALKVASNVMRSIVKGENPQTSPLFAKMADYITTRNSLNVNLAKPHIMTMLLEGIGASMAAKERCRI